MLAFASAKRLFNLRLQHKSATVRDSVAHKSEEWLRYVETSRVNYRSEWFAIGICVVEQHCQLHCFQICNYNGCATLSQRFMRFYRLDLFSVATMSSLKFHTNSIDGDNAPTWFDVRVRFHSVPERNGPNPYRPDIALKTLCATEWKEYLSSKLAQESGDWRLYCNPSGLNCSFAIFNQSSMTNVYRYYILSIENERKVDAAPCNFIN